ncbi:hypothetical protein BGW39_009213 [Mortierella sp. 14UC]|nr:hypothetical protein BGW39_009213 [Mortierella sp. 14UC]
MNTFEQPIPFQPAPYSTTAPIPPPRSSSAIRSRTQMAPSLHSPSSRPPVSITSTTSIPTPEPSPSKLCGGPQAVFQDVPQSQTMQATSGRPNSFYAEADFEDAPPAASAHEEQEEEEYLDVEAANEEYAHDEEQQQYQQNEQKESNNSNSNSNAYPEPEFSAEALIRPVAALMQLDLAGELIYFKDRFADLQHGQPGFEQERVALLELERSTEALMDSRKVLTEKQRQLLLLHINDSRRPNLQAEVIQLTTECRSMEHQWRTGKEAYHRDYVVAAAKAAAAAAAKANAELKAKTEKEIDILKGQIANLQRQLDAVAARRAQMLFATQGAA